MAIKPDVGNANSATRLNGEEVAHLREEIARLRRENEELRFERDLYQQQLLEAHRAELTPFTDEERRDADESGLMLGQFVEELRTRSGAK